MFRKPFSSLLIVPGRCWAATTTEGLLIYSLDAQMLFDPFELDTSVTPARIRAALRQRDFTRAILLAFRLNERKLLQETLEAVPWDESEPGLEEQGGAGGCVHTCWPVLHVQRPLAVRASLLTGSLRSECGCPSLTVEIISSSLPDLYVEKVLEFLASSFEVSRHLEFYLIWTQKLLMVHGQKLKSRYTLPAHRGVWSLGPLVGVGVAAFTRGQRGAGPRGLGQRPALRIFSFQSGDAAAGGPVPSEEHPAPLGRCLQTVCDVSRGAGAGGLSLSMAGPARAAPHVVRPGHKGPPYWSH